jgi:AraC-like DNA-binding protein
VSPLRFEEFRPDPRLREIVHRAWCSSTRAPVDDFLIVPDGCMDVLFSADAGLQVVGAMTGAQSLSLPAGVDMVGLRLRPGAAVPWLRVDAAQLTDDQVSLRDVLGSPVQALEDRLRAIEDPRVRARALCDALSVPLASSWDAAHLRERALRRALAALARAGGELSIEWLALQCGVSPRQFQRRCRAATGVPPKLLARVLRLMRALRTQAYAGDRWTRVAAECGYADQAHFTHDFKDLVGCSPEAYVRRGGDVRFSQGAGGGCDVQSPADRPPAGDRS